MNSDEAVAKTVKTYEALAKHYHKIHFDINENKDMVDFFIQNLKGKKVLDVGCGPGRDAKYFSEKGLDVTGIDLTPDFIKMACLNAPNAKFVKMDMRHLDFPNNTFDGIWVCASFQHVPKEDARSTMLEFKKVLKSNGFAYISVQHGEGERFVEKAGYMGRTKFFAFYTEDEFKELAESCGLRIVRISVVDKGNVWIDAFVTKN